MFDYEQSPMEKKGSTDYTGLKIVAILAPVLLFFIYLGNADVGLAVCIVLAMIVIAIKIRWHLRRYIWFWVTIGLVLVLHVPLFYFVRWPQGKLPTIFYAMPVGIADFLIILGVIGFVEKIFFKNPSSNDEEG